jgi:hypothetical protein
LIKTFFDCRVIAGKLELMMPAYLKIDSFQRSKHLTAHHEHDKQQARRNSWAKMV